MKKRYEPKYHKDLSLGEKLFYLVINPHVAVIAVAFLILLYMLK